MKSQPGKSINFNTLYYFNRSKSEVGRNRLQQIIFYPECFIPIITTFAQRNDIIFLSFEYFFVT